MPGRQQEHSPAWGLGPFWVASVFGIAVLVSCKTSCDDGDGSVEVVRDGLVDSARTVYQSVPWDGRYHAFPPQKRLEFEHGLGRVPFDVSPYVAFSPCPLAPPGTCHDDPDPSGEVAQPAGDLFVIYAMDARSFTVRNSTCETFYLRVVALATEEEGLRARDEE